MSDIVEDLQLGLYVEPEKAIAVIQALRQRVEELEVMAIRRLREQVINDFAQIDRGMEAELAASQQRVKELLIDNSIILERMDWEADRAAKLDVVFEDLNRKLAALKQAQSEPVARIVDTDSALNVWWYKTPKELGIGTKLYTSVPTIPEGWQLVPIDW